MVRANRQVDYERVPFLEDGDRSFRVISVRMAHPCRNMPCVPAPKTIVTESLHSAIHSQLRHWCFCVNSSGPLTSSRLSGYLDPSQKALVL
jgi:hypothetical protein